MRNISLQLRSRLLIPFIFTLLLLCTHTPLQADTVVLTSGDTLHGTIVKETDDTVELEHPLLGTITLPRDQIASIEHTPKEAKDSDAQPDSSEEKAANTTDDSPPPDTKTAPPAAVSEIATAGTPAGLAAAQSNLTDDEAGDAQAIWKSQLQLGYGLTQAGNDTANFNIGINTTMTKGIQTLTASANYQYQSVNDEVKQNRLETKIQSKWQAPDSPWITSVQGFYDHAEFQEWDDRLIANADIGYEFIKENRTAKDGSELNFLNAVFRVGGGFRREFGNPASEETVPEGLLGLRAAWKPTDNQTFSVELTYFPDILEIEQYRFIASGNYEIGLEDFENLSLIVGIHYEYDSHIDASGVPTYLRINVGLGLDF